MENNCMLSKKILLLVCLFESWIKQFHSEKKIKYVVVINVVFSFVVSLILAVITYIFFAYFMVVSAKENSKNAYTLFYFSSFRNIGLIYFIILITISFQNLFDASFNIANKFKVLALALFQGITFDKLLLTTGKILILYFGSWIALTYTICTIFDPYIGTVFTSDVEMKNLFSAVLILSLIIIFLVQVYGINNSYKSTRRKVIVYSISTLLAGVTTLKSIAKIANEQEFSYIFSVEFIYLTITLLLSFDRLISSLKTLVKEYSEIYNNSLCKICIIDDLTFENVKNRIKYFFKEKINTSKSYYHALKKLSMLRKLLLILYLSVTIPVLLLYVNSSNIDKIQSLIGTFFTQCLYYISTWLERRINFRIEYISDFLIFTLKILGTLILIVIGLICIVKAFTKFKRIEYQFKNRKIKKISYENLYKELIALGFLFYIAFVIIIIPFVLLDLQKYRFVLWVFEALTITIFAIFVLALICWIFIKVSTKISQYKGDEKKDV